MMIICHRLCAAALVLCTLPLAAQEARDPTVAPGESATTVGASPVGVEGMTVLVRDGKPYLVVGTRLYAVGDKVGEMRVKRIAETEVWLHDGRSLIKVPRFAGIERTALVTKPACGSAIDGALAPAASASKPMRARAKKARAQAHPSVIAQPSAMPCEDTQP